MKGGPRLLSLRSSLLSREQQGLSFNALTTLRAECLCNIVLDKLRIESRSMLRRAANAVAKSCSRGWLEKGVSFSTTARILAAKQENLQGSACYLSLVGKLVGANVQDLDSPMGRQC